MSMSTPHERSGPASNTDVPDLEQLRAPASLDTWLVACLKRAWLSLIGTRLHAAFTSRSTESSGTPSHTPPNTYSRSPFYSMKEHAEADALLLSMFGSSFQKRERECSKLSQELLVW